MLTIRNAQEGDVDLTYEWANDPLVRKNSYHSDTISFEGHKEWFLRRIKDSNSTTYIGEVNRLPIGLVRFDRLDRHAVIGVTVAPDSRGKSYASSLLELGLKAFSEIHAVEVYAYIKTSNEASVKAFGKAGFQLKEELSYKGVPSKLMTWK